MKCSSGFSSYGSVIKVVILWQEIRLNEHEMNPAGELVSRCDSCWGICINEWNCSLWKAKKQKCMMIKRGGDKCVSRYLPYGMTNVTSVQWSMKHDRLGHRNLQRITATLLITSDQVFCLPLNLPSWRMLRAVCELTPRLPRPTEALCVSF